MIDKTPLERDIESREMIKTSRKVTLFVILLLITLSVLGYYVFSLKQELYSKEQEIKQLEERLQNQREDL